VASTKKISNKSSWVYKNLTLFCLRVVYIKRNPPQTGEGLMNGHTPRPLSEFGMHLYPGGPHQTSDCSWKHVCGGWAGPSKSGAKPGINPLGKCPGNVPDEPRSTDYEDLVDGTITDLEAKLCAAIGELKKYQRSKDRTKRELLARAERAEAKLAEYRTFFSNLRRQLRDRSWRPRRAKKRKAPASAS